MLVPKTINFDTFTNEEAAKILSGMQKSSAFLFDVLNTDSDGILSPAEIDAASEILRSLDTEGDGELNDAELGGHGLEGYGHHSLSLVTISG